MPPIFDPDENEDDFDYKLEVITVYNEPPGFVARRTVIVDGQVASGLEIVASGASYDEVIAKLPIGMTRIVRHEHDHPTIVESWI